jgi:hypothetical protein
MVQGHEKKNAECSFDLWIKFTNINKWQFEGVFVKLHEIKLTGLCVFILFSKKLTTHACKMNLFFIRKDVSHYFCFSLNQWISIFISGIRKYKAVRIEIYSSIGSDYIRTTGVRSLVEVKISLVASMSRPALRPTQLRIKWVTVVLSWVKMRGRVVTLTTHPT